MRIILVLNLVLIIIVSIIGDNFLQGGDCGGDGSLEPDCKVKTFFEPLKFLKIPQKL